MSRTHIQAAHGFRSLGITTFVIAASFFANAVPALAQANSSGGYMYSSPGSSPSASGSAVNNAGGYSYSSAGTEPSKSAGQGSGSLYKNEYYGGFGNGRPTSLDTDSHTGGNTIATLQARIAQLDAMKAQLQKLLDALKARSTATQPSRCPLVVETIGSTTRVFIDDSGMRRNSFGSSTPSTITLKNRVNNDPRRCADSFGGASTSTWNHPIPLGRPFGGGSYGGVSQGASSTGAGSFRSSFGGGAAYPSAGGPGAANGMVHGASSDMSAEMADVLSGLTSDLLDLRDSLDQ